MHDNEMERYQSESTGVGVEKVYENIKDLDK